MYRGCFSSTEDDSPLAKGVPTFRTKEECIKFCEQLASVGSNPDRPELLHSITHFIGSKQMERDLKIRLTERVMPLQPEHSEQELKRKNRFAQERDPLAAAVRREIIERLEAPHHSRLSAVATANTLRYSFEHMRCGILVQIRDGRVYTFAPFVNDEYHNTWGKHLRTDPAPLEEYYHIKQSYYRRENILPDPETWWANGNIICNEHDTSRDGITQWWGDNLLLPCKHMLETVCRERHIPDCDFFFNKRDHPQLRKDLTEPYDFLFDEKKVPLPSKYSLGALAPFVSFYASPNFSDLPIPTNEDWRGAVGEVFPESTMPPIKEPSDLYTSENFAKFKMPWDEKTPTAFFRGNATGGGTTPENNQRLRLAQLGYEWNLEKKDQGTPPLLDAGVTGFNLRDKKMFGEPMRFAKIDKLKPYQAGFVPMYKQSAYKYVIYVQGHCAANRYAFLMRLGSVIIRIASTCEASELWFFPILKAQDCSRDLAPGEQTTADHILIKPDLSDLKEKLEWCRRNDEACRRIANKAGELYHRYAGRDAIIDYMEVLLFEISRRTVRPPLWYHIPDRFLSKRFELPPIIADPLPCSTDGSDCARCNALRKRLKEGLDLRSSSFSLGGMGSSVVSSSSSQQSATVLVPGSAAGSTTASSSTSAVQPKRPSGKPICRRCKRPEDLCKCKEGPSIAGIPRKVGT